MNARSLFAAVFLLFASSVLCLGQRTTAQLTGTITDATGAVVPHAQLTATHESTGLQRDSVSNELGYYTIPLLPPGTYRIAVKVPGFRPITRSGVVLEVDQVARVDFALEVGTLAEAVEVTANASRVDTQTATLKEVVDQHRIRELPLNGRDATQLVLLLPGVYGTDDTSGLRQGGSARSIVQPGISSNGARSNMVNYTLDGAFHNDTYTNAGMAMPNPDALQEFSVQTNSFSAEFGRSAGAIVNAVTRSGTNEIHGTLFEFHRNEAVNARNFFASGSDGLKRHQFGGTLGGPVYLPRIYDGRNRTFFFFSQQETRQKQTPSDLSVTVLTEAQRRGDFSARTQPIIDPLTGSPFPGNIIPADRINPVTRNFIDQLLPLPSEPATGLLRYKAANNNDERQIVLKVDHQFSSKDTLTARYLYNFYHQFANDVPLVFATRPDRQTPAHNISLNHVHIFRPNLLNQAQVSINRRKDLGVPVWNTSLADLGMRNVYSDKPHPTIVVGVTGAFSIETTEWIITEPNVYTFSDTLRWTRGGHEMTFGFEYRFQTLKKLYRWLMDPTMSFAGNYTGYGVADFYLGLPSRLRQKAYGEFADLEAPGYSTFFQDNIRVTPRLTLNLGVRFEPTINYVDIHNRGSVFRQGQKSQIYTNAPTGLLVIGDPGVPRGQAENDINNIAPRFGFAWAPFGNGKTSVRGAYGIFYDSSPMSAINNGITDSPPFALTIDYSPSPGPFDDPYNGQNPLPMPSPPPSDIDFPLPLSMSTYPQKLRAAYLQSWHLTFERELRQDWMARIAYAGSKGTGLLQGWQYNPGIYIPGKSTLLNTNERRPLAPEWSSIGIREGIGNSNFNSLQLTLDKRFSKGFTAQMNYTWGKSIDSGSGAGTLWPSFNNPFNFRQSRGLSDFHHEHRFVASGLWELPRLMGMPALAKGVLGGWSLSGAMLLESGRPFSVLSGRDNSMSGVGADFADLTGDTSRSARQDPNRDPVLEWFNTQAFVQNAEGTFGNSGRNIIFGPGHANVNLSVSKSFPIAFLGEASRIQFRGEFFNLFNRVNLLSKRSESLTSGTYGRITSAADPRILQFALKWHF